MTEPGFLRATRASYDALAEDYAEMVRGELAARPLERALLAAFAELVRAGGGGPVADVGCGTGRITAYLHGLGLDVSGIDLSPGMLAVAREAHPELRFQEGSMLALDLPDASVAGVLAWYSIIHVPRELLPDVFAEFRRVLAPGGHLLLGFQAGSDTSHRSEAFGRAIDLDFRRQEPDRIAELLTRAGLAVRARLTRERDTDGEFPEKTAQGFVLARKQVSAWVAERPKLNGTVTLAEYSEDWPGLFEREAARIRRILGDRVLLLEHMGSTSVPGLAAKPIIDILLVVPDPADEAAYVADLERNGYKLVIREPDWHEHRCLKGPDTDINLHVHQPGSPEIERHLRFRDRLRSSDDDRRLYEDTKRRLAAQEWTYIQQYADAKNEIVAEILNRARPDDA